MKKSILPSKIFFLSTLIWFFASALSQDKQRSLYLLIALVHLFLWILLTWYNLRHKD